MCKIMKSRASQLYKNLTTDLELPACEIVKTAHGKAAALRRMWRHVGRVTNPAAACMHRSLFLF